MDKFGFSNKPSPTHCPDCNYRLGTLQYNIVFGYTSWHRDCKCGCIVIWSYPNVWKRRHILPIMDDKLVLFGA